VGVVVRMLAACGGAARALAGAACAGPSDSKERSMSSEEEVTSSASRVGRPSPRPLAFESKRFESERHERFACRVDDGSVHRLP